MTGGVDSETGHPGAFRRLWCASAVSTLGDGVRYVAFPLLAAGLTSDPRAVAAVFVAGYAPWPLFGLAGGALVDRHDRRTIMWATDGVRALVVAALAAVLFAGGGTVATLAAVSFALGVAETLFDNAASAMVPQLVAVDGLDRANSRLLAVQTVNTTLLGAPLGAALYGVDRALPTAVDAASFAVAAVLMCSLPGGYRAATTGRTAALRTEIADGLQWLWRNTFLRTACLLLIAINGTIGAAEAVLVLYSKDVLHLSDLGYTALLMTLAVGGVVGTFLAPAMRRRVGVRSLVGAAALGQAAALLAAGLTSSLPVALAAMAVVGTSNAAWNVVTISLRQATVPAPLLGRVTSAYRVVALSAMPLGAAAGGLLAHRWGLHVPYLLGGTALTVATLGAVRWLDAPDVEPPS
ncbi:MAG: MFS transporter [Motilibacteraceae bacterium]